MKKKLQRVIGQSKPLIYLEIIYTIIALMSFQGIKKLGMYILKDAGIFYVTQKNILTVIRMPMILFFIMGVLMFYSYLFLLELHTVKNYYFASSACVKELMLASFKDSNAFRKRSLVDQGIIILGVLLFNSVFFSHAIPRFDPVDHYISEIVFSHGSLVLLGGLGCLLSVALIIRSCHHVLNKNFKRRLSLVQVIGLLLLLVFAYLMLYVFGQGLYDLLVIISADGSYVIFIPLFLMVSIVFRACVGCWVKVIFLSRFIGEEPLVKGIMFSSDKKIEWILVLVIVVFSLLNTVNVRSDFDQYRTVGSSHRGGHPDYMENSIEAIQNSLDTGVEMIEIDVSMTKDQQIVLTHDLDISRLTGIDKKVSELTLMEMQQITIDYEGNDYRFCSLEEVVELVGDRAILNIELKSKGDNIIDLAQKTESLIGDHSAYLVCSRDINGLVALKEVNANRKCGYISASTIGSGEVLNVIDFISIKENRFNHNYVRRLQALGKEVFIWTVNDMDKVREYCEWNVDGIISDNIQMANVVINDTSSQHSLLALQKYFY